MRSVFFSNYLGFIFFTTTQRATSLLGAIYAVVIKVSRKRLLVLHQLLLQTSATSYYNMSSNTTRLLYSEVFLMLKISAQNTLRAVTPQQHIQRVMLTRCPNSLQHSSHFLHKKSAHHYHCAKFFCFFRSHTAQLRDSYKSGN